MMHNMIEKIQTIIEDKKGEDVNVLDVTGHFPFADYFVIATARNERMLKAIAEALSQEVETYKKTEGSEDTGWIIVEVEDIIVHLFLPQLREYYALETLWQKNN